MGKGFYLFHGCPIYYFLVKVFLFKIQEWSLFFISLFLNEMLSLFVVFQSIKIKILQLKVTHLIQFYNKK